jgi:trigger factor
MESHTQQTNGLERHLDIAFPLQQVESEVGTRLKNLARTARLPGFRPGKVPFKLVEQQYGGQVRQEVVADSLQRAFSSAVKEQNLRVAGFPRFEPKEAQEQADTFEFIANFEVYPEISVGDLTVAVVKRPITQVGDTEIDKTIEVLRKQRTKWHPAPRAAADGDQVVIDYEGSLDAKPFKGGSATEQLVVLGEGRLHKDFEAQLIGMQVGESKTFDISFPEDYPGQEVAGKTVSFAATLKSVSAGELPAVDEAFAKALGIKGGEIAKLREEVRGNLEREVSRRTTAKVKEQVMQALLDASNFAVPNALIESETNRLRQNALNDLQARGMLAKDMTLPSELFADSAVRRAKLGLVISELVNRHTLEPKAEQVRALVEDHAKSYEQPEAMVSWYYQNPQRLREAEAVVVEDNVVSWVLSQVKVEDTPSSFDELMGNPTK